MWGWLSFTLYCCCPRQGLKGNKISLYTDSLVNGLNFRMGMSVCWIHTDRKRLGDFKKDISAIIIIQQHVENNGLQYRFCVRLDAVTHDDQQIATDIWFWLVHFPQHISLCGPRFSSTVTRSVISAAFTKFPAAPLTSNYGQINFIISSDLLSPCDTGSEIWSEDTSRLQPIIIQVNGRWQDKASLMGFSSFLFGQMKRWLSEW